MNGALTKKQVCAVVGVGPGNGSAIARRFAREGYAVALLARTTDATRPLAEELEGARAFTCDVTDEASVRSSFESIERVAGTTTISLSTSMTESRVSSSIGRRLSGAANTAGRPPHRSDRRSSARRAAQFYGAPFPPAVGARSRPRASM